jgi:phosphate transport system substrate-binding protein
VGTHDCDHAQFASDEAATELPTYDEMNVERPVNPKLLSACLVASIFACAAIAATAGPLEIAGSTTVQKSIVEPVISEARVTASLELRMLGVGTGKGMKMLFDGKVPVAAVSDDLVDAIAAAKKAGALTVPENLKMVTILTDHLVAVVHPDNPVQSLSKDQLAAIFGGKITNWKDVGGADRPIIVVVGPPYSGTRDVIERLVLHGGSFSEAAKEMRTTFAELSEVARNQSAIGCLGKGAAQAATGRIRELKGSDISRPLGFVTVGEPSAEVMKLYDFLRTPKARKLFIE